MNVRALPACHWASLGLADAKQYSLRDESHRVQGGLLPVSQGVAVAEFEARIEFRPFFLHYTGSFPVKKTPKKLRNSKRKRDVEMRLLLWGPGTPIISPKYVGAIRISAVCHSVTAAISSKAPVQSVPGSQSGLVLSPLGKPCHMGKSIPGRSRSTPNP